MGLALHEVALSLKLMTDRASSASTRLGSLCRDEVVSYNPKVVSTYTPTLADYSLGHSLLIIIIIIHFKIIQKKNRKNEELSFQ